MARQADFTTIRTEGALLPPDLLRRLRDNDKDLPGLGPDDYHLVGHTRVSEAISEAWNKLQGTWATFRDARSTIPDGNPGTATTRDRWLLPLFQVLDYGRLQPTNAREINGRTYPISHGWMHVPIHLVGCNVDLDTRTAGVAGAARQSPHGLVQSYLNASEDSLWGIVSNGFKLRLLRDNNALSRQSYLEFDLEAMLNGEVYPDFVLFYLTLHQSRLESDKPEAAILEQWTRAAQDQGTRALDRLRDGVQNALSTLGQGFLEYPANGQLRSDLKAGMITPQDYYRQLLRFVYRLIVVFAAEDRDLLHPTEASTDARERYTYYSTRRLRELADAIPGGNHPDQYQLLKRVWRWLGNDGAPDLAIPALGGFLFDEGTTQHLMEADLSNRHLLTAVRQLAFTQVNHARYPVDYKNLGAEELGSVYESLLELQPRLDPDTGHFTLATLSGNERKTTGSYYTPTDLISLLLDSALDPVLDEASHQANPEEAILDLKIVDPACGSGHFLIAAAHRVARRLAQVRTGDDEPTPQATRQALRDTIAHCIYGVDLNDMAAELCKVALWLETLEPGKPLSFLDHHIKSGNSLIGAPHTRTLAQLVHDGIPDEAYAVLLGDDRAITSAAKRRNREERGGQQTLFSETLSDPGSELAQALRSLEASSDDDISSVRTKEAAYQELVAQGHHVKAQAVADAWTAAFMWPKKPGGPLPITNNDLLRLNVGDDLTADRQSTVEELRQRHRFFHWRIEFAHVFHRQQDGFDVVLGNPPWERIKLQEQEWFAARDEHIANAPNAAERKRRIKALEVDNPSLYGAFQADLRAADSESHFIRNSGNYPLNGRGDINTYAVFAELNRSLMAPSGRAGFIVPSGIATDHTTQHYFRAITESHGLASLYDFENRRKIFPAVDSRLKFSLVTLSGTSRPATEAWYVFFAHTIGDIRDPDKRFTLSAEDIKLFNPNTRTAPTFRSRRDMEITKKIYQRFPVLVNEEAGSNPWGISFMTMFHMANDSGLFRTREDLERSGYAMHGNVFCCEGGESYLPLYEAKMIHQFDHRYATYEIDGTIRDTTLEEHQDPTFAPMSRYWVSESEVDRRLSGEGDYGDLPKRQPWLLGFRDITNATNERTAIFTLIPRAGTNHKLPLVFLSGASLNDTLVFLALVNSHIFDYLARQGVGGTSLGYFVLKQLPVPDPTAINDSERMALVSAAIRNIASINSAAPALKVDDTEVTGTISRRVESSRLDALCFGIYGLEPSEVEHVMNSFSVLRRREISEFGRFLTLEIILAQFASSAESSIAPTAL